MDDSRAGERRYRFADLILDTGQRRLLRGSDTIPLGKLTYELLVALVRAAPNVVTHDRLVDEVWGGRSTSPETITQRVKLLRDALADPADHPRYVGLVRNQGYHLIPPVEVLPPADASTFASRRRWSLGALAAVALAALVTGVVLLHQGAGPAADPVPIAVLPFSDYSSDPQEYFADGMTEALIASLAKLKGLSVISRTSSMRFKDTSLTVPEMARELNVPYVLEGSAQLEGEHVLITTQLIDAATDRHLWAGRYERDFRDVLKLQGDVAHAIAREVGITVTPGEAERLAAARAVDPETYRAYLRGMYHLNKSTPEEIETGLAYLHRAVDADPGDALAYAGLALGYARYGHGPAPLPDVWPRAKEAAERAIALDPELAEAYAALGDVKLYMEWDWQGAEAAFRRAIELSPSLAMPHYDLAWYLILFERWDEAIAEHRRAQQLDPLTPLHTLWLGGLYLYQDRSRWAEAIAEAERALAVQPDNAMALFVLGRAQAAGGMYDAAIETHRKMSALNPNLTWELGLTYATAGRLDETRAILEQISREAPNSFTAFGRAMLHAQLGEIDEAFHWLDYSPPHAWVPWVRVDPWLRPHLEDDPRFDRLLARMGLPP